MSTDRQTNGGKRTFLGRLHRLRIRVNKVLELRLQNGCSLSDLLLQSFGRTLTERETIIIIDQVINHRHLHQRHQTSE